MKTNTNKNTGNDSPMPPNADLLSIALRVLNKAYTADPAAIHSIVNLRVPCNQILADHPTIQVGVNQFGSNESFDVGLVGILNGIIEAATGQRIAVAISNDGEGTVSGFIAYNQPASVSVIP